MQNIRKEIKKYPNLSTRITFLEKEIISKIAQIKEVKWKDKDFEICSFSPVQDNEQFYLFGRLIGEGKQGAIILWLKYEKEDHIYPVIAPYHMMGVANAVKDIVSYTTHLLKKRSYASYN